MVASLICPLYACKMKEGVVKGSNTLLHDLAEKINQAKSKIKELQIPDDKCIRILTVFHWAGRKN